MIKCTVKDCEGIHRARGFCETHYVRFKKYGHPQEDSPIRRQKTRYNNAGFKCSVDTCAREAQRGKMCFAHYQRLHKHGETFPEKPITEIKGWHHQSDGYIVIPAYGHPNGNQAGSIMEHIKRMSDYLGRPLTKDETVHHKNGIRDDNRIENLELWSGNHPKGSRVSDLIKFALDITEKYGTDPTKYA